MNILGRLLQKLTENAEKSTRELVNSDPYRLDFHLMPPTGWLNDPNGLCWFRDRYHAFFQYCPFDANGGLKLWGHYTTTDFVRWEKCPVMLYPDEPWNVHGAYSGSALIENDRMYLFYTGNVKSSGNFDYVSTGREQNTVMAISDDGMAVNEQKVILKNLQYPEDVTLHVRDPKILKEEDGYYVILGARNKKDCGEALVYKSVDLEKWELCNRITTEQPFGYMWECPDLVSFGDQTILFLSPQGIKKEKYCFQNKYACGYFPVYGDYKKKCTLGAYQESDFGFDYYAQQTFQAPDGRVLAMAWMGMPDADYSNPTALTNSWQHCMTLVRELTFNGTEVCSLPAEEYRSLRKSEKVIRVEKQAEETLMPCSDLVFQNNGGSLTISLDEELVFDWTGEEASLTLSESAGDGRTERFVKLDHLENLEMIIDHSSVELFINNGSKTMSTRFYPKKESRVNVTGAGTLQIYQMSR